MQIISPPPGLLPYPNAGLGEQIGQGISGVGDRLVQMMLMKKQMDDEKSKRTLEYWMKTGELMGEFEKPTPAIQEAFKKYYGQAPDKGVLATGGKTLEARKTEAAIKEAEASTALKASQGEYYKTKGAGGDGKGLEYAVKYANAKLGKPFEVLDDNERDLWTNFYNEGLTTWSAATSKGNIKGGPAGVGAEGTSWLNRWRLIPESNRKAALSNPSMRAKVIQEATALGVSPKDLEV